jgi:undecaprenyl-diphosphatase
MLDTLRHIDCALFNWINHGLANPILDMVCPILRNKLTWIPLYVFLAFLFYKQYGSKLFWIAAFAGVTLLITDQISSSLIKPLVHRLRPCNNPAIGARLLLSYCGAGYSFVSSHAANHFGIAFFLIPFLREKFLHSVLLVLWAALVSFSQVYVGVHFPMDVVAGALLGAFVGFAMAKVLAKVAAFKN